MSVLHALATFIPVLDSLPDPLIILDGDGRIVFINRQTEELFGYTQDDLVGQALDPLVPERFRQDVQDYPRACVEDPTPLSRRGVEVRALKRDGTELPASFHASRYQGQDGTLTLATVHDTSERGVVEQDLRVSKEHYGKVAELSHGQIFIIDREGEWSMSTGRLPNNSASNRNSSSVDR